jgi:phosphonate transport system substrate-binding protein
MKNIIIIFILFAYSCIAHAENSLNFGIVPQQSATKLAKLWGPIFNHLEIETGIKIRFETAPNIPIFEQRLASGKYDLAYMNPYHYVVFSKVPGYKALGKASDKSIKGIMVVRKASNIQNLNDLNNSELAFPAPAAFAASILTRTALTQHGVLFTAKYVSSHDSVYRAVAKGIYPAGGGVIRTFNNSSPEIRKQLEIMWTSKGYTPHAIAAHPRVNKNDIKKIQIALINMRNSDLGKTLLKSIKIKGFAAAADHDWNDVRALNIALLETN